MAVSSEYRQTGTIARIVDANLNAWVDFAGIDINIPAFYQPVDASSGETDQAYWAYRGQAAMCQIANGSIIRVRNGNQSDVTSRDIQIQTISDPTDASQWQVWTSKSWGTNYAVAIERDDAATNGYRIYHAKSDGVYMDNVKLIINALPDPVIKIKPVYGQTNMIYLQTVRQNDQDTNLEVTWYYVADTTPSIGFPVATPDCAAWHHYHHDLAAVFDGSRAYRFRGVPLNDVERNLSASDTLTVERADSTVDLDVIGVYNTYDHVTYLKGPSKRAGFTRIDDLYVAQLTDPEYGGNTWYLFYTERHLDQFGNTLSNLKSPQFWSRAPQGLTLPSQATPTGYSLWGFAGVIEFAGYVYMAGNSRVLRRLIGAMTYDITNYVLSGRYEIPRDNAAATLELVCANPQNVVGQMLGLTSDTESGLTDRTLDFGIGMKLPTDTGYTFKRDARWFVASLRKTRENNVDHVTIEGGDFWHKASNPFRDAWSIPGQFNRTDWQPDADNDISQYTNAHDEIVSYNPAGADPATVPRIRSVSSGQFYGNGPIQGTVVLYSGWRGANAVAQARFWGNDGGFVFRYQDEGHTNIIKCDATGTYLWLATNGGINGTANFSNTTPAAQMPVGGATLAVDFRWQRVNVYINDNLVLFAPLATWSTLNGYVGLWSSTVVEVSNFTITEPIEPVTFGSEMQQILAYCDEHNVNFEEGEESLNAPDYDRMLGPQSDWDTPEKALRGLMEASNLDIVWRQDSD